jgi:tetratricopeptide (TPR) repeat protein
MRNLSLAAAAAILAVPASASVTTLGDGYAVSCYRSAEARLANRQTLAECDAAFTEPLMNHDRVATHVNRGILRLIKADYGGAQSDFDAAILLDPREPEAWLNKGILLVKAGKSGDAMAPLDRSLQLRTRRPALAYFARGLANEYRGNVRAAYRDLKQAQALEPEWMEVSRELARYQVRTR